MILRLILCEMFQAVFEYNQNEGNIYDLTTAAGIPNNILIYSTKHIRMKFTSIYKYVYSIVVHKVINTFLLHHRTAIIMFVL